jgi:hypothetical protein
MQHDQHLFEACSAMADGHLSSAEANRLQHEMMQDESLRAEYETVNAVRTMLRERADRLRMPVPADVERSIRLAIAAEQSQSHGRSERWLDTVLDTVIDYLRRPAIAVGVAAVALVAVVWFAADRSATTAPFRLYEASYANFQDIVGGTLELGKRTSNPAELAAFFRDQGVAYDVFFPTIDATLEGGVVSEHHGQRYAHLVYRAGDHLVYIFEVDEPSIEGNMIAMASDVADDLEHSRWHWEERAGVGTMFVWESNNIVCSAVSDLRTQDLSALFHLETL